MIVKSACMCGRRRTTTEECCEAREARPGKQPASWRADDDVHRGRPSAADGPSRACGVAGESAQAAVPVLYKVRKGKTLHTRTHLRSVRSEAGGAH